jgi:hypothetical protein
MDYIERAGNLHVHTTYSDGSGTYVDVAEAAERASLDFVIVTDHNAYHPEEQGWYGNVLMLAGEEVNCEGAKENHLLVYDAGEDLGALQCDTDELLGVVRHRDTLSFIAHPFEHSGAYTDEPEIDWTRWDLEGYTGLEVWNYMSEFKSYLTEPATALLYAVWPRLAIRGPYPETLARWDELAAQRRTPGIGGADAHAGEYHLGPLRRRIFGYRYLFGAVNTHLLVSDDWTGNVAHDAALLYEALRHGRGFIGYEHLGRTRGFRFTAARRRHAGPAYTMGDEIPAGRTMRFHAQTPAPAHLRMILNGFCVAEATGTELIHESRTPGVYRVEAWRRYAWRERMWILSNPIYIRE